MGSKYKKEEIMSDLFDALYHEEFEALQQEKRKERLLKQQEEN